MIQGGGGGWTAGRSGHADITPLRGDEGGKLVVSMPNTDGMTMASTIHAIRGAWPPVADQGGLDLLACHAAAGRVPIRLIALPPTFHKAIACWFPAEGDQVGGDGLATSETRIDGHDMLRGRNSSLAPGPWRGILPRL